MTESVPAAPLLTVNDLSMAFPIRRGVFKRTVGQLRAVDGVDLTITEGETLGLVGESGCGKTTLGRCIVRSYRPTSGRMQYRTAAGSSVEVAELSGEPLRDYQREVRLIFQDPFSSLNPRMTLRDLVGEPLRTHKIATGSELDDRVAEMLRKVGLRPDYLRRYPHAFSGGERQRVNIARALILQPRLVIADEAVSALDVSVRAQILNLLRDLQEEFRLTYLFISHDLSVVEYLCDRTAVMYLGRIVEQGPTRELFRAPRHPYTEALLGSVPRPDPDLRGQGRRKHLAEDLPDPGHPPSGCRFHTRCPYRRPQRCADESPELGATPGDRTVACHFADQLELTGIAPHHPEEEVPVP
ncbi:ABC transporter ATP-binding protein [Microlunatus parietis]|uniref:Peptide/nickel transport system ATP-binding protein n=1 Tax=Microlunatus parietis TaxID=682979 RepID=A0A7Y9I3L4_9ACTN|nr:oligopeptide/dipeptide ABC transporter ATP-binding protein [Microlunatus parietis]NYE69319.1 peptide/nickel transport system ATP-binding protein [Microlunatus parietis]